MTLSRRKFLLMGSAAAVSAALPLPVITEREFVGLV